jgi:hypothetical protein
MSNLKIPNWGWGSVCLKSLRTHTSLETRCISFTCSHYSAGLLVLCVLQCWRSNPELKRARQALCHWAIPLAVIIVFWCSNSLLLSWFLCPFDMTALVLGSTFLLWHEMSQTHKFPALGLESTIPSFWGLS